MGREIELKFQLKDKKRFFELLDVLNITLSNPVVQKDTIFLRHGKQFSDLSFGEPIIRIREEKTKITTTVKKYVEGITDRQEIECEILDKNAFETYLELLNIYPIVRVNKTRHYGYYKGSTICVDEVKELGIFVEIEIIADDSSYAIDRIKDIALELNLSLDDVVKIPYDEMLFNKKEGENL